MVAKGEGSAVDYNSFPAVPRRISMKCALQRWVPVFAFALVACAGSSDVSRESTQTDFGVNMARQNLWREAMVPFPRGLQMKTQNEMAHNNLAVGYQANGHLQKARHQELAALPLDPSHDHVQEQSHHVVAI